MIDHPGVSPSSAPSADPQAEARQILDTFAGGPDALLIARQADLISRYRAALSAATEELAQRVEAAANRTDECSRSWSAGFAHGVSMAYLNALNVVRDEFAGLLS